MHSVILYCYVCIVSFCFFDNKKKSVEYVRIYNAINSEQPAAKAYLYTLPVVLLASPAREPCFWLSLTVLIELRVWPWNLTDELEKIGHLFYATSSFVHHFMAIAEFKMELQSGNAQFDSKLAICCPVWPWNLMDDIEKQ